MMSPAFRYLLATIAACVILPQVQPLACSAQQVPFVIPPTGPTRGSAADQSSLNAPIERVVRNGEHFLLQSSHQRIRFFGLNIAGPDLLTANHDQIKAAAVRLASMGCNVVRLHHLDNMWGKSSRGSLWSPESTELKIDRQQLDKLHFAIHQFEQRGIYINLNLKVSKELSTADGIPAEIDTGLFVHQKRVDRYYPKFIDHQRRFARVMLHTVNPYNKLAPKDDPGVAFVEINNENSIMSLWPGQAMGHDLDKLPAPYVADLQVRWNQWLKKKYGNDAKLLKSWSEGVVPPGPSVVDPMNAWFLNRIQGAEAELQSTPSGTENALPDAVVRVQKQTGTDWHVQLIHPSIDLTAGQTYSLMFECRSNDPGTLRVSSDRDQDDYRNVGLSQSLQTTNDWTAHELTFKANQPEAMHSRLVFHLGLLKDVELRGIQMIQGHSRPVVQSGTSLAQGNLSLPSTSFPAPQRDWIDFLADLDRAYSDDFRKFLRDELQAQNLICDSQVQWGGTTGYYREQGSDFIDTHAYWEHPEFLGGSWNPNHWKVERRSQVAEIAKGESTALVGLARVRQLGKPFAVSEYDHPSVNDYQVEMIPMIASFGCVQDWDALYQFCHGPIATDLDRTTGYFDQTGNPAKFAFYPSMSRMFRKQLLPPAAETIAKTIQSGIWHQSPNASELWNRDANPVNEVLNHRVGVRVPDDVLSPSTGTASDKKQSSASEIHLTKHDQGAVWAAHGPAAVVCTGFIGKQTLSVGAVDLQVGDMPDQFGSITLVTLDDKPIQQSERMLLTAAGRSENLGMGWNEERTSVGNQWGKGPVQIATVDAVVTIDTQADCKVYALDSHGERTKEIPLRHANGRSEFSISSAHQTVWYEVSCKR